jgi:hypothetical protein
MLVITFYGSNNHILHTSDLTILNKKYKHRHNIHRQPQEFAMKLSATKM